jgi:hypothetical protein
LTPAVLLSTWIKSELAFLLEGHGFARSGTTFKRLFDGNLAVIQVQKSRRSSPSVAYFTINLGVWSSRVSDFLTPSVVEPVHVTIGDCHWTMRLGETLAGGLDQWWEIRGTSYEAIFSLVSNALIDNGLPLLLQMTSDIALRDVWRSGNGPGLTAIQRLSNLAVLLHEIGPSSELRGVVEELRRLSDGKPIATTVLSLISRLSRG